MLNNNATGKFTSAGTLAAVTVNIGFKPSAVYTWTDDKRVEFTADMTAGKGFSSGASSFAELSSNGITLTDTGFTVGTSCQKASAVCYWQAIR